MSLYTELPKDIEEVDVIIAGGTYGPSRNIHSRLYTHEEVGRG